MTNLLGTRLTSGRKQTSVYKDNDVSKFHLENHGIRSQFSCSTKVLFMFWIRRKKKHLTGDANDTRNALVDVF